MHHHIGRHRGHKGAKTWHRNDGGKASLKGHSDVGLQDIAFIDDPIEFLLAISQFVDTSPNHLVDANSGPSVRVVVAKPLYQIVDIAIFVFDPEGLLQFATLNIGTHPRTDHLQGYTTL